MKTIWYWHFHVVCDKLFLSMWTPPVLWVWLATPYSLYHRRLFYSILSASAYSILPSIAGGLGFSLNEIFFHQTYRHIPNPYLPWPWKTSFRFCGKKNSCRRAGFCHILIHFYCPSCNPFLRITRISLIMVLVLLYSVTGFLILSVSHNPPFFHELFYHQKDLLFTKKTSSFPHQ